jgi:hypothetical protein
MNIIHTHMLHPTEQGISICSCVYKDISYIIVGTAIVIPDEVESDWYLSIYLAIYQCIYLSINVSIYECI